MAPKMTSIAEYLRRQLGLKVWSDNEGMEM
jgi:hypothetical protein